MELWLFACLFAVVLQSVRTGVQKHLKGKMSNWSITWIRFGFGVPVAIVFTGVLLFAADLGLPPITLQFLLFCLLASLCQIAGTQLVVMLFDFRKFSVGVAYVKTEAIQAAIMGSILFAEVLSIKGYIAVCIGFIGVFILSLNKQHKTVWTALSGVTSKAALIGMSAGGCFALGALAVRNASLSLASENVFLSASLILVATTVIPTVLLGAFLLINERHHLMAIRRHWKLSALVGAMSAVGSLGWFIAFTLQKAAYVKTVGQIDLLLSLCISHFWFKEKANRVELFGMALILMSIFLLVY